MNKLNLPVFPAPASGKFEAYLALPRVRWVTNFVLGPRGTNIEQACRAWVAENNIEEKAKFVYCPTPEKALDWARRETDKKAVPLFWTCAVYFQLNQLFFEGPDVYPFLFSFDFPLDNMQLCVRWGLRGEEWGSAWRVASHPSPTPLVASLGNPVVQTTSNAQAAKMCAGGETEACVTTEQAARIHRLATIHEFGSPVMVFFAGTTQHGMNVLLGR